MAQVAFLYRSDEPGSIELRLAMAGLLLSHGARLWSDTRAVDAGFSDELAVELDRSDAIVHCVGPKGLGRYQEINELDRTVDALQARRDRRLVIALLGGAQRPDPFKLFDRFSDQTMTLTEPDARDVLRAALPQAVPRPDAEEGKFASQVVAKTRDATPQRSLTIILSPYAFAEGLEPTATPASAIRHLLRDRELRGFVPWLDVLGSIARATETDDQDAAQAVAKVLSLNSAFPTGPLGTYLRLVAANWARVPGEGRLFVVNCGPDIRADLVLRSSALPVQHLRLVHCPREPGRLLAERVTIVSGRSKRDLLDDPDNAVTADDRVVLIKPFGCFEQPEKALLTAEHWRESSSEAMPLPHGVANQMTRSFLIVLGAGAFSPSLQIVFKALLREALQRVGNNANRYLIHNGNVRVPDPLHRVEAALARADGEKRERFEGWLLDTYGLRLKVLDPLLFFTWLDHLLNDAPRVAA